MASQFRTIGLIGKYADPGIAGTVRAVAGQLRQRNLTILADEQCRPYLEDAGEPAATRETIAAQADLIVVIGGDGTLLNAARSFADASAPLLGVNLGRLGFLAELSPEQLDGALGAILEGQYQAERRNLLETAIARDGQEIAGSNALNDAVVHKWDMSRMIELETWIEGAFVNTQRSDGLIVATPTGSTAYALSSGGPLVHPELDASLLVPICPHTLSFRPFLVPGHCEIRIRILDGSHANPQLTCDGQVNLGLLSGDEVVVRRKAHPVTLLHPADYDYYQVLRAKLHWATSP